MSLTLRSTKLAPPVYQHTGDYEVLDDGKSIGRIYEIRAPLRLDRAPLRLDHAPLRLDHAPLRLDQLWFWSITVLGAHRAGIHTEGRAPTFEHAKAQFQTNYERWREWAT
jgi:hypothetical protein